MLFESIEKYEADCISISHLPAPDVRIWTQYRSSLMILVNDRAVIETSRIFTIFVEGCPSDINLRDKFPIFRWTHHV